MRNFYASLPLPTYHGPRPSMYCSCPPTASDYLLAVYLVSFSKPNERIMANKGKQGQVGYHRCRLDCRMKEFDLPTNQRTQPLKDVLLRAEKKIVKTCFSQERKQTD